MYTIDANVFVRDAQPLDPEHQVCHALLAHLEYKHIQLIVPLIIQPEVASAVARSFRDPMRGMDAIYVAVARQYGCTFVTLDDEPYRRAAAIVSTRKPAETLADLPS